MPTHRHSKLPRPLNTLDSHQAGRLLGIQPGSLSRKAKLGIVKAVKMGRLYRYPADEMRRLIRAENTQAVAQKLLDELENMVAANNAAIVKEAANGRRKD
jgi:hypothetical protein